jgi:hypothetical protein
MSGLCSSTASRAGGGESDRNFDVFLEVLIIESSSKDACITDISLAGI